MISIAGEIRKFALNALGAYQKSLRLTGAESLAIAQVEPSAFELSRAGYRFFGGAQSGATGRAPVAVIPTTAAAFLLWNGDLSASYAVESLTIAQLSGTAAIGGAILAALTTTAIAAPTAATGYSVGSASQNSRRSKAIWADAQTLGATPVWSVLKANGNPASTTNGGDTVELNGSIIIPPGYGLALHYLSGTGTSPLFMASARWSELSVTLE